MSEQITQNELQEKLDCIFADVGSQIGDILRCMVEQEVASHVSRIKQLQGILSGDICGTPNPPN